MAYSRQEILSIGSCNSNISQRLPKQQYPQDQLYWLVITTDSVEDRNKDEGSKEGWKLG